jgi:YYY domain-containing protein
LDYKLFSVRNIVAWVLAVEILGLAVLPALRAFFGNRRDAALLSRPIGLALTGWLAWALSLVVPFGFSRGTIALAVAMLGAVSFAARRLAPGSAGPFWGTEENRAVLFFWLPTALFLIVRAAHPEILDAEKFMDLAFFTSLTRHPAMPPVDPWMAGKTINYYYWGYLLVATVAKAASVNPFVAYNLAIATFAGFSFAAAACLGFRLSAGRTGAAVGAGFACVFAGNLMGALDAWARPFAKDFDYWHASRVIGSGDTINEFPFFTFFHADLHAHLLAFPFFLASFAVADRWIEAGAQRSKVRTEHRREPNATSGGSARRSSPKSKDGGWESAAKAAAFLLVALVAATAIAANPWNGPAIAILLVFAGMARTTRGETVPRAGPAAGGALVGAVVVVAALALTYPYFDSFHGPDAGIGKTHATSGLFEFFGVWGILFAVAAAGLLMERSEESEENRRRRDFFLAAAAAASVLLALARKAPALVPILFLAFLAGRAAWRALSRNKDRQALFASFLCLLALGMIAGCELVYFKDNYGEQLHRMNTVFKFYHQAWPLLAIGAVVFVDRAWRAAPRPRPALAFGLAIAAFAAVLYPATAMISRLRQQEGAFTLDARSALERRNPGDLKAIEWLGENAPKSSIVMEAAGDPYTEFARISSHTGIPSVLGWANHEGLWRSNDPDVINRLNQVRLFYTTPDPATAQNILRRYHVTHVVVGDLERRAYGSAAGEASLPLLDPALRGSTTVYRVARGR